MSTSSDRQSHSSASPNPKGFGAALQESGLSPRALTGRALAMGGAVLVPLFLLLPYASAGALGVNSSATGWELLHGSDIMMFLASIGVVSLLGFDLFAHPSRRLEAAATALCFISVGIAWPDLLGLPANWDVGAYLVLLTTLVSAAGASLALSQPLAVRAARPFTVETRQDAS